jgi:hypothetical protein
MSLSFKDHSWMFPPKDVHNAGAWDKYWKDQVEHGWGPRIFDLFCDDNIIVKAAHRFGLLTVLCVGNGISQEPVALSKAGLHVTAMDISPVATALSKVFSEELDSTDQYLSRSFCRSGGTVDFVIGDIFNRNDCPGPYDIVIERRTVQVYPKRLRPEAVSLIIARLSAKGILLSHCHDSRWSPLRGGKRHHATEPLIAHQGVKLWKGGDITKLSGRIALIWTSSG